MTNLKSVFYEGTEEDWNKIDIRDHNSDLTEATAHYSWTGPLPYDFDFDPWIEHGVLVKALPDGISYDLENGVITLDHYQNPEAALKFHRGDYDNLLEPVTLKLIGENTIASIWARTTPAGWLQVTGDGTLNLEELEAEHFVMDSGTINLKCTSPNYWQYGFYNMGYGNRNEENLNYFRFLGGTVNVDMTAKFADPSEEAQFVGMDVQSGNIEIRNAEVHINLGDNQWLGLGVGWASNEQVNGGTLTMENGTLEITSSKYQAYLYELKNEGDPLHYYVGTDGPEKEVAFDEAFIQGYFHDRYEATTDGKGYLLITDKPVKVQPPKVTPTPEPTPTPAPTAAPTAKPTATPTAKPEVKNPFKDVTKDQYYYEPVLWAVNHTPQITQGTSATTFSPANPCTRGQIVTFLYRDKK